MTILEQAHSASNESVDTRHTIEKLTEMGFGDDDFKTLHHFGAKATIKSFSSYSRGRTFVRDGNNHRVHQRLRYVQLSCPAGVPPKGKSFQTLAVEASRLIPPFK